MSAQRDHYEAVYGGAQGDPALVPWADLAPKPQLLEWLETNAPTGRAMDVACGLGDNAEALAQEGWDTIAFDISSEAIEWAKQRFPKSSVDYQVADLFDLPSQWLGTFDLVVESYIFQTMPPEYLPRSVPAVCSLVKPGGRLLVYTRLRDEGSSVEGPPWPLQPSDIERLSKQEMRLVHRKDFILTKGDRRIPHTFMEWVKHA
ncbi:MAG: class I SAM-dependent methyltransferase [Pseudomonadota bacterium]